jgi:hypothetical protein
VKALLTILAALLVAAPLGGAEEKGKPGGPALIHRPEEAAIVEPVAPEGRVVIAGTARVEAYSGGLYLLKLAGRFGVLIESQTPRGRTGAGTVYEFRGRAADVENVRRFQRETARDPRVVVLWLGVGPFPEPGATEPVPLMTLAWSPLLYHSHASVLTSGPVAGGTYYLVPGTGQIVEASRDGKKFVTAFRAVRPPAYVEGGMGLDLTRLFWKARVESWMDRQEKIRQRGWMKYGWIFEEMDAGEPAETTPIPPRH